MNTKPKTTHTRQSHKRYGIPFLPFSGKMFSVGKFFVEKVWHTFLGGRKEHGEVGVRWLGHRRYVGGDWEMSGKRQLGFMRERGLSPGDVFVDVGCGSLRAGIHFIDYLDRGNYLGIDKEALLVTRGVREELGEERFRDKAPELVISRDFGFGGFSKRPRRALAHSLFTHLTPDLISRCLASLEAVMDHGLFYATFFEGDSALNPKRSHDHHAFYYSRTEMEYLGRAHGWEPRYIGDWGHPAGQKMMEYRKVRLV